MALHTRPRVAPESIAAVSATISASASGRVVAERHHPLLERRRQPRPRHKLGIACGTRIDENQSAPAREREQIGRIGSCQHERHRVPRLQGGPNPGERPGTPDRMPRHLVSPEPGVEVGLVELRLQQKSG